MTTYECILAKNDSYSHKNVNMKPVFTTILGNTTNEIFATKLIERPYFTTEFHFHAEAQLTYVVESEGRRMIGDSIGNFYGDELTLLGANLPHVWHNDKFLPPAAEPVTRARSVALFFQPDKVVEVLSNFIDITKLKSTLSLAQRGMIFNGATKQQLKRLLLKMCNSTDWQKLQLLIQVFETISKAAEYELLASPGYNNTYQAKDNDRIDKILKYVFNNYANEITLQQAATLVHMNKEAFCRYFKSRTQKTFIGFVNEVRIAQACKLMAQDNCSLSSIAYKCGYNSLSNFNGCFKNIKKLTPREYKKIMV